MLRTVYHPRVTYRLLVYVLVRGLCRFIFLKNSDPVAPHHKADVLGFSLTLIRPGLGVAI